MRAELQALFHAACIADVNALKPGNVGIHADGHGMCAHDFIASADACAGPVCSPDLALGERIFAAVEATQRVVSCNTNLGLILLCAPLIHALLQRGDDEPLREVLVRVLEETTLADAAHAYRAIRLAGAGGLGSVDEEDVRGEPGVALLAAMRLARDRDLVAAQYANAYREVFEHATPLLLELRSKWGHNSWAVTGVFLTLLAEYPDSLVVRRHGAEEAHRISRRVAPLQREFVCSDNPETFRRTLLTLDANLKAEGINPGTTADLTVAGVFVADLMAAQL